MQKITIHARERTDSVQPPSVPDQLHANSSEETSEIMVAPTDLEALEVDSVQSNVWITRQDVLMRLGALILGSISLVPHIS
jgi:hypothetical protein